MSRHFATRRDFLQVATAGFSGMAFSAGKARRAGAAPVASRGNARSTILLFLCGGASHLDSWDMKPKAPVEYRGPFQPIQTSAPGVTLCEHLPLLAQQAHHLAVVNSVDGQVNTNDHHAGYYHNLTGHRPDQSFVTLGNNRTPFPDDWPFMGSVVGSKRRPHAELPNAITLPHKPSKAPYTRPGQFAGRLGVQHNPLYVQGSHATPLEFTMPSLTLSGDVTPERLASRESLLGTLDRTRQGFDDAIAVTRWSTQRERAASLLMASSTTRAFDVSRESAATRERYGQTVNGTSLLAARRLVEEGVPFVTVFWYEDEKLRNKCKSAGGWDTHGNNFELLKNFNLPTLDQNYSALITDLEQRGLLESTLVIVMGEMGRTPKVKPNGGRDHWTQCGFILLTGGGVKRGMVYGESDKQGGWPIDGPVSSADYVATIYQLLGLDPKMIIRDRSDNPVHIALEGEPVWDVIA